MSVSRTKVTVVPLFLAAFFSAEYTQSASGSKALLLVDGIEADKEGNRPLLVNWMAFQHTSKVTRLLK